MVWYVSVYKVRESRIRRTNIICDDLIYRPFERVRKFSASGQTDRQTDTFAITKTETQFYKLRTSVNTTQHMSYSRVPDLRAPIPLKMCEKTGGSWRGNRKFVKRKKKLQGLRRQNRYGWLKLRCVPFVFLMRRTLQQRHHECYSSWAPAVRIYIGVFECFCQKKVSRVLSKSTQLVVGGPTISLLPCG